jgi:NAD(P)-binding Rossmann-like domain
VAVGGGIAGLAAAFFPRQASPTRARPAATVLEASPVIGGKLRLGEAYLETSFLPGRTFTGPATFNAKLGEFFAQANRRWRRAMGCAPADRIAADKAAMLALPTVAR